MLLAHLRTRLVFVPRWGGRAGYQAAKHTELHFGDTVPHPAPTPTAEDVIHDKGITVDFVATEDVDGVPMHHLTMQISDGEPWDIYFDVETGLWSRFVTPAGGTVTIHDYRPTGEILFPRLTGVKGRRRDGTPLHHLNAIIWLEINVPIDDALFRPDRR